MTRRDLLLELAEAVAPDQSVTVPAAWLLEALRSPIEQGDLTVAGLCRRYGRKPSAVRAWLAAGRFTGAYRIEGREWRVPPAALAAFDEAQRIQPRPVRRRDDPLASWRAQRKGAA